MTKQGTILVVDDNKGILTAVQMLLGTYFEKVITISTPNKIKATLHDENIDVVLLDMNFSAGINTGNEGLFWLSEIIIRKTKCFDFWERNVLFPKTKRSFFRTPTPSTLPFSA